MPANNLATEVLGAMITPAVLISATGTLLLSTSNRLSRAVDRVRVLTAEAERMHARGDGFGRIDSERRTLLVDQLTRMSTRVTLLRSALTVLYSAIGILVATSITVGLTTLQHWPPGVVGVGLGLLGASALLLGSLLLVREANLAVGSTLQETRHARELVLRVGAAEHAPADPTPWPVRSAQPATALPVPAAQPPSNAWPALADSPRSHAPPADPFAIVMRFNSALNAGDIDAMMALLTPDCVFENTAPAPDGTRYTGQAAVRAFWTDFFKASAQPHIEIEALIGAGDCCTMLWRYSWMAPDGRPGHVRGVDVYTLAGDQIRIKQSYVKG